MDRAFLICLLASIAGCGRGTDSTDPFTEGIVIPGATTALTIQVNSRIMLRNGKVKPDIGTLLEDFYERADRQRLFLAKVEFDRW